jgi:hypothetical protein
MTATTDIVTLSDDTPYVPTTEHQTAGTGSSQSNAMAYFLEAFCDAFEQAAIQLQNGETQLTESFGNLLQYTSENKNNQLNSDNTLIENAIDAENQYIADGGDDSTQLAKYNNNITLAEQDYKTDDANYQSMLQILNTDNESNINLVTSISQNNASIYQIGTTIANIVNSFAQLLSR